MYLHWVYSKLVVFVIDCNEDQQEICDRNEEQQETHQDFCKIIFCSLWLWVFSIPRVTLQLPKNIYSNTCCPCQMSWGPRKTSPRKVVGWLTDVAANTFDLRGEGRDRSNPGWKNHFQSNPHTLRAWKWPFDKAKSGWQTPDPVFCWYLRVCFELVTSNNIQDTSMMLYIYICHECLFVYLSGIQKVPVMCKTPLCSIFAFVTEVALLIWPDACL